MENNYIFLAVAVTIVIAVTVIYAYPSNTGNPAIEVVPAEYSFGEIPQEEISHTFELKNTGKGTLEIIRITTSCGCTTASADSTTVSPGQSTDLIVTFDPNAMEEPVEGEVLRIVYIKSNDPEKPELEIELTANVIKGL